MKTLTAGRQLTDRITLQEVRLKKGTLRYDPQSVCLSRIRDIILDGVVRALPILHIQKEVEEKAKVRLSVVAVRNIVSKYLATLDDQSTKERIRWSQNERYDAVLRVAMATLAKMTSNDPETGAEAIVTPTELKRIAETIKVIQAAQADLLGLNQREEIAAIGASGPAIQFNFNINSKDAGYPDPIESVIEGEVVDADD